MTKKFAIEEELAKIGDFFNGEKSLTVTSWYGKPAKLDIRSWARNKDGEVFPKGGITLTDDEALRLILGLCRYFNLTPPSVPVKPLECGTEAGTTSNGDSVDCSDFFDD